MHTVATACKISNYIKVNSKDAYLATLNWNTFDEYLWFGVNENM